MLALTFILLLVVGLEWAAQCDEWSGPAGTVECIQIPVGDVLNGCIHQAKEQPKTPLFRPYCVLLLVPVYA